MAEAGEVLILFNVVELKAGHYVQEKEWPPQSLQMMNTWWLCNYTQSVHSQYSASYDETGRLPTNWPHSLSFRPLLITASSFSHSPWSHLHFGDGKRELIMPLTVSAQFLQDIWVPMSLRQAQDPPLSLGWSLHPSLLVEMKKQSNLSKFPATLTLFIFIETTLITSKAWHYFQVISKHFQVSWLNIKPKCVTLIVKKEGGRIRHPLLSWENTSIWKYPYHVAVFSTLLHLRRMLLLNSDLRGEVGRVWCGMLSETPFISQLQIQHLWDADKKNTPYLSYRAVMGTMWNKVHDNVYKMWSVFDCFLC